MPKSVKDKDSKKKKSKAEEEAETEALEAELEPKYTIDRFYDLRPMFDTFCVFLMGFNLFLFNFLPGAHYAECVCSVYWITCFATSKYISQYKGTEHAEYGMNLLQKVADVAIVIHEILQVRDPTLASEESRNAHASMVILTKYFLNNIMSQICTNPRSQVTPWPAFVIIPAIVLYKPRFGIFAPQYEALAFFVAMGLGYLIGSVIDEMSWRHHVQMHKKELEIERKTRELSKEIRKREMAMEVLESYNDTSSFFEIRR